jgi:hypothetical protein
LQLVLEPTNSIVKIIDYNISANPNLFLIDELSKIYVRGVVELEKFNDNNWKILEIDNELIAFKDIRKIESEEEIYSISYLIRGLYGTEKYIKAHEVNVSGVIITKDANIIEISESLINQQFLFQVGSINSEICFENKVNLPLKPILISNYIKDSTLYLSWIRRNFKIDMWHRDARENLDFSIEIIAKDQVLNFMISSAINRMEIDISTPRY